MKKMAQTRCKKGTKSDAKDGVKLDANYDTKIEAKNGTKQGAKNDAKIDAKNGTKLEAKTVVKPNANLGAKYDAKFGVEKRCKIWRKKGRFKNCTIELDLAPGCSSQLQKKCTKIWR